MTKVETKRKKDDTEEAEEYVIHGEKDNGNNKCTNQGPKTKREESKEDNKERASEISKEH